MTDYIPAIKSLRPGASWSHNGDTLAPTPEHPEWGLIWFDQAQPRPTDAEIEAEAARLAGLPPPQPTPAQKLTATAGLSVVELKGLLGLPT